MKALQSKKLLIIITVVLLCAAVIVVIMAKKNSNETLTITDVDSGKEYAALTLPANREFSITFIHSVNKSPVTDVYIAKDDEIYLDRTLYYGFGAGVPTTISEGQHFAYGENGEMIISGYDMYIPDLIYVVGTVSDHVLAIGEDEISLRDICAAATPRFGWLFADKFSIPCLKGVCNLTFLKKRKEEPIQDTPTPETASGTTEFDEELTMEEMEAKVQEVMEKYDRESNTRKWVGLPNSVIRYLMVAFAIYCVLINFLFNWETRIERASFSRMHRRIHFPLVPGQKECRKETELRPMV